MAGEQKRKAREVLVTKALLLGYTFKPYEYDPRLTVLVDPNGARVYDPLRTHIDGWTYPALWVAAKVALKLAGVQSNAKVSR